MPLVQVPMPTAWLVIDTVQTFFVLVLPKSKIRVLIAMVLRSHFSQFLRFSESPTMSPNVLNHCVIHEDFVEHVDNQKRFQKYSYPLVYFTAFQLRG